MDVVVKTTNVNQHCGFKFLSGILTHYLYNSLLISSVRFSVFCKHDKSIYFSSTKFWPVMLKFQKEECLLSTKLICIIDRIAHGAKSFQRYTYCYNFIPTYPLAIMSYKKLAVFLRTILRCITS